VKPAEDEKRFDPKAWVEKRALALLGVERLTAVELRALRRYLARATGTNCFWATYRVRDILLKEVDLALLRRCVLALMVKP
jgi:hypothetical protein